MGFEGAVSDTGGVFLWIIYKLGTLILKQAFDLKIYNFLLFQSSLFVFYEKITDSKKKKRSKMTILILYNFSEVYNSGFKPHTKNAYE